MQGKKSWKITLLSKYVVCDSKKSKSTKEQEASGLLGSLGIRTPLSKIALAGSLFLIVLNKFIQGIKLTK